MKFKQNGLLVLTTLLILFSAGCSDKIKDTITYTANVAVYQNRSDFITTVKSGPMQDLQKPGKIFLRGNYIFINELYKGIHVIDNTNPASPQNVAFITIPGNIDIQSRGNRLYVDSFTDLVVLDITDPTKAVEISRVADAFPNVLPPTDNEYPVTGLDATKGVVVGWKQEKVTAELTSPVYGIYPMGLSSSTFYFKTNDSWASAASGISGQAAVAGSLARFALYNDMLYALTNTQMKVFSINDTQPLLINSTWTNWQTETLFISGQLMFAGTRSGLAIYSLATPSMPKQISSFSHLYSCDPVVVAGNLAYYTIRSGNGCGQTTSGIGVVNISDPLHPTEVSFFALPTPFGLGIDNNHLFVCTGDNGLQVFDASNPLAVTANKIAGFTDIPSYDVIPYNNILIVVGKGGLAQYDYSDITHIKLISSIETTKGNV